MIGSTTGLGDGNFHMTFVNQIIFASSGLVIMLLLAFIRFDFIAKFYLPMYAVNIGLLILVLFINQGGNASVARWIGVDIGGIQFGIQPSEFAKILMIIFLAKMIDKYKDKINNVLVLLMLFGATVIPVALIFLQPSYSASMVVLFILFIMLFSGGIGYRYIVIPAVILAPLLLFLFIDLHAENPIFIDRVLADWQIQRVWYFLYPELDYSDRTFQNRAALQAMSSGLLTGRGLFNNTIFVPESSNDFIFAIIAAELGFLGTLSLISISFVIVIRCFIIANRSYSNVGKLIASGVGGVIAFQVIMNVAVNTWVLPNTGVNFPFISSGGSSMWVFMGGIGIVLNIGMMKEVSMFDDLLGVQTK